MKTYGWSRDRTSLLIHRLTPRKEPQYRVTRRLGGFQSRLDVLQKRRTSCPYVDSNPGRSSP